MRSNGVPEVSVVIPVLDEVARISRCLDALAAQEDAPRFEVVVVDNGSSDGTAEAASRHPLSPRVVRETRRGPYVARNAGIAAARAPVIALTDADCSPTPGWLRAGLAEIAAGADAVGGAVVQSLDPHPTRWARYDAAMYLDQSLHIETERFAATANLFVRREVFERFGGFRPELVASGDVEFGRRITDAGCRLVYGRDAIVLHRPRSTLRDTWRLHRKLGSGFAELARAGLRMPAWRDPALRVPLGWVAERTTMDGAKALRRRQLIGIHLVAMSARWLGRLSGRG